VKIGNANTMKLHQKWWSFLLQCFCFVDIMLLDILD